MRKISSKEIVQFQSPYLNGGRAKESWIIDEVKIDNEKLYAKISMKKVFLSPTDINGFHLTVFSALEFISQLIIIYFHVWANLTEKKQEAWMLENTIRIKKSIRSRSDINVNLEFIKIRKIGLRLHAITQYTVTDDLGGHFEGSIKSFIS